MFWHALGVVQSGAMLTESAPALEAAGLRAIAPDAPGFGRSAALPPEAYDLESLGRLLQAVLDERGLERALLMGHSWGGTVALWFAAHHPERAAGLILLDSGQMDYQDSPGFGHGKSLAELIEEAGDPVRLPKEALEAAAQDGLRRPLTPELLESIEPAFREEDGELVAIATPEVRGAAMHGIAKSRVTELWPAVAEAGIPILLLLATEPQETREQNEAAADVFAARFPKARIEFLEGAGHDLLADAGPEVGRLVASWASQLAT